MKMLKYCWSCLAAAGMLASIAVSASCQSQTTPMTPIKAVPQSFHLSWLKGSSYAGNRGRMVGDVHLDSPHLAAQAETVVVDLLPGSKSANSIERAQLDPLPGHQVSGHFEDLVQGRRYQFLADHAVYAPDRSHAEGGRIDLNGHVRITVNAPAALDGPLVTTTDHATVLLGQGTAYPQISTGPGQATATPLTGGQ